MRWPWEPSFRLRPRLRNSGEAAAFAREVFGRDAGCGHQFHSLPGRAAHRRAGRFGFARRRADDASQLGFRTRRSERLFVFLFEQFAPECEDAVAHVPAASVLDALLDEGHEPAAQLLVVGDAFDERVALR